MMDRIYALDLFDEINPEALPGDVKRTTVAITFSVKEKPIITRIIISGNKQIRTTEIKDAMSKALAGLKDNSSAEEILKESLKILSL